MIGMIEAKYLPVNEKLETQREDSFQCKILDVCLLIITLVCSPGVIVNRKLSADSLTSGQRKSIEKSAMLS